VHAPETLDAVLWIITKYCARSRNFGNYVWIITKESARSRNSGIEVPDYLIIQKFWVGPETLDQFFFRSYRHVVHVPETLDAVVVDHNEILCTFQKFWRLCLDHNQRKCTFQKFWNRNA
jgi:hypothetical protein